MDVRKEIDYTALSSYLQCPRKFYWRQVRNLKLDGMTSHHLIFGLAWHAGLEHGYKAGFAETGSLKQKVEAATNAALAAFKKTWFANRGNELDQVNIFPKNEGRGLEMLIEYFKRFSMDFTEFKLMGAESSFTIPLGEGMPSYIGRRDLDLIDKNGVVTFEHKTMSTATEATLAGFDMSLQVEGYLTSAKLYYDQTSYVVINGAICQKSKFDFTRYHISRKESAINRFLLELYSHVRRLLNELAEYDEWKAGANVDPTAPMPVFLRNPGDSCVKYFRRCEYFDLCMARNNPEAFVKTPLGFIEDVWDPRRFSE